jgi:transcriptional regulator with XRE-family HTH domain
MNFADFLQRSGLTHREVAEKLGCSVALVSSWSTNRIQPSFEKILQLIDLGLTTTELFGEKASVLAENSAKADWPDSQEGVSKLSDELAEIKARLAKLESLARPGTKK